MTEKAARKAVVTLDQVNAAFEQYKAVQTLMGRNISGHSFDRGLRGKGFAQYSELDAIVRPFDTKDDALTFYLRYVEVAQEVMADLSINPAGATDESGDAETPETPEPASNTPDETTQEVTKGTTLESTVKTPAQKRRKVAQEVK